MIRLLSLRAAKFKQLDDVALQFPARGSVLIQGLNEAGKSTLFESVFFALFGKALVTEEPNRLDDLINYQSPRALVKLVFSTDGANFAVSRTLNRGKSNNAMLEVEYAGGKRETVTNLTSVNRRIVDELGLDGEAVLNSCFVEQKKLEKLESMTAQQRRDTLLRLLNLDRLTALEAQYKPSSNDDYQLQQLRDRLKLAEIQRDLPPALERRRALEAEMQLISGARLRCELAQLREAMAAEQRKQAELQAEASRLAEALVQVERLETVRDLARAAGEALLAIEEDRADMERLQQELDQLQAQAARTPELEAEVSRLDALAADLAELAKQEEVQAGRRRELDRLAEASERLQRLRLSAAEREEALQAIENDLASAQAEAKEAEACAQRARQTELLQGWLQVREVALIVQESERDIGQLRQELFGLEQAVAEHAADRQVRQWAAFGLAAAALLALALAAGLAGAGLRWAAAGLPLAVLLAVACWRFARRARSAANELKAAESAASAMRVDLNRREGEQALARRTGQDPQRLAGIEVELGSLGLEAPASVLEARELLAGLEIASGDGASSKSPTAVDARQRLGALEGRRQGLERELRELRAQIDGQGDPDATRAQLEADTEREAATLANTRQALSSHAASEAEAREMAAAARAAHQAAKLAAQKHAELSSTLRARRERLTERDSELAQTWTQLEQLEPAVEPQVEACRALWRATAEQIAVLDEPGLRKAAADTGQQLAAREERVRASQQRSSEAGAQLQALDLDAEQLAHYEHTALNQLDSREVQLQQEQGDLFGRVAALQDRQSALEQQLGLQDVAVDYAEAEQALSEFQQQIEVHQQAYRIVTLARRNIVGKVLPSTIRNMGLLLPLLTNDRYRDVDIDAETYKIRVWDETARAMKAKDIFSGGTRDQFSLALRLAFALATLPEELGTAPGFIFLDEPLSSFDAVRTNALVNLLTRGPVAANFEQIFVISHNRAFDEQLFDYHLQLDEGRIVASDLPELADVAGPAQAQLELAAATS